MRNDVLSSILFGVVCATVLPSFAVAEGRHDQITIVIPAIEGGSTGIETGDALWMSYIVGQSIRRYFERPAATHRSALIVTPELENSSRASLSALARINGAQISLGLKAFVQRDGALITVAMVIPERYQDFRTDPVELLPLDFEQHRLTLDLPSRYVVFTNVFLSTEVLQSYKSGIYREICPIDKCDTDKQLPKVIGPCLHLGKDVPLSQVTRSVEIGRNTILQLEGRCYQQRWPPERPVSQAAIDFIAGVQRYFTADWNGARTRMLAVARSEQANKRDITIQSYLYLSRISMRLGNEEDAAQYVKQASALDDRDPQVVETRRFVDFWLLVRSLPSKSAQSKVLLTKIEGEFENEPAFVREPYQKMLAALRAHLRGR